MSGNQEKLTNEKSLVGKWIKTQAEKLNTYGSLIVAIATVALVFVTYFHINEAKKMRQETKRSVDFSIEQFKIKSYPTLIPISPEIRFEGDTLIQKFTTFNQGDITAFKTTFLLILAFKEKDFKEGEKESVHFQYMLNALYKDEKEEVDTLTFESKLPRTLSEILTYKISQKQLQQWGGIEKLYKALFYIRFKVPYDDKYTYEEYGYILRTEKQNKSDNQAKSYRWQKLNSKSIKSLSESHVKYMNSNLKEYEIKETIRNYFRDYKCWQDIFKKYAVKSAN